MLSSACKQKADWIQKQGLESMMKSVTFHEHVNFSNNRNDKPTAIFPQMKKIWCFENLSFFHKLRLNHLMVSNDEKKKRKKWW